MILEGKRETGRRKERVLLQGNKEDTEQRQSLGSIFNLKKDASGAVQRLDVVARQETKDCAIVSRARKSLKVCVESKLGEQLEKMEENTAHISKKRRLDLLSVTQVSHHGSQAMKKSIKARIARAFLRVHKSKTTQGRRHSSIMNTHDEYMNKRTGLSPMNGSSGHKIVETGVLRGKPTSQKVETKRLKEVNQRKSDLIEVVKEPSVMPFVQADQQSKVSVNDTNGSIKVSNGVLGMPCVSAEKESKASVKRKRSMKGSKHKGKSKSKDKVHLPGCPHLARRWVEGNRKSSQHENQGTRRVFTNGVVSNDGDDCKEGAQDVVEKSGAQDDFPLHCEKSKEKDTGPASNGCHFETGDKGDDKIIALKVRVGINFDGHYVEAGADGREILEKKVVQPWKTVHNLRRKTEEAGCVLSGRMLPVNEDLGLLGHDEAHVHAMQAALNDRMNVGDTTMHKKRKKKVKKLQPETEQQANGFIDPGAPLAGQHRKKHRVKLRKHSHQPDTTSVTVQKPQEPEAELVSGDPTNLTSERNARSAALKNGQEGNAYARMARFDLSQSEIVSTKACNNKQPLASLAMGDGTDAGKLNGNEVHLGRCNGHGYYDYGSGFDISRYRSNGNGIHRGTSEGHGYDGGHEFETGGCNGNELDSGRLTENHRAACTEQESAHVTGSDSSDEDERKQKGRSKFERWTSHSEARGGVCVGSIGNNGSMQIAGRISLSSTVRARQTNGYTAATQRKENDADLLASRRTWKVGRKQNGRSNGFLHGRGDHGMNGLVEQQSTHQGNHDQFMAKLEKRRERFKFSTVEENVMPNVNNIGLSRCPSRAVGSEV